MSSIFRLRDKNDWEKRRGNHTIRGIRLTRDSWPDDRRDLKCRKARPQRPRLQMSEALMLQSVPPYVDTHNKQVSPGIPLLGAPEASLNSSTKTTQEQPFAKTPPGSMNEETQTGTGQRHTGTQENDQDF